MRKRGDAGKQTEIERRRCDTHGSSSKCRPYWVSLIFSHHDPRPDETSENAMSYQLALKAFANSSPGFALKPWVERAQRHFFATLKELRLLYRLRTATQLFQSCIVEKRMQSPQGCQSATLGWN